jgi:hypothetical protein
MSTIDTFCAVNASGLLIPDRRAITALALLFDKVHLPAHIKPVKSFAQRYRISSEIDKILKSTITSDGVEIDPFSDLDSEERKTALRYLHWSLAFSVEYMELFGEVFQTDAFEGRRVLDIKLVREGSPDEQERYKDGQELDFNVVIKGRPGIHERYKVRLAPMVLTDDDDMYPRLIEDGYVPIVTHRDITIDDSERLDLATTKQMTALLAMKSVEMLFPRTRAARPDVILEARHKLRDQLPQFWSAMFKLTNDLRKLYKEMSGDSTIQIEAENLVDSTVRPALLDLRHKLEAERKQWFFKVLSSIQKGLRLMIGNPPLTLRLVISSALVLASVA